MRSLRLASLILALFPALSALADENPSLIASAAVDAPPKNIVRVNPIGLVQGNVSLEYERVIMPHVGIGLSADYQFAPMGRPDGVNTTAFAFMLRPLFYLSDRAPHGWYLSPFLAGARVSASGGGGEVAAYGYLAGAVGGYSWLAAGWLNIDVAVGAQYVDFGLEAKEPNGAYSQVGISGVLPAAELSIGFAF